MEREDARAEPRARWWMKGEHEKARTQRKATEVWNEECENGGAGSEGLDRQ